MCGEKATSMQSRHDLSLQFQTAVTTWRQESREQEFGFSKIADLKSSLRTKASAPQTFKFSYVDLARVKQEIQERFNNYYVENYKSESSSK